MNLRVFPLAILIAQSAHALTIYVAPDGNDAWSGRVEKRDGTNGPKATVKGALEAARTVHRLQPESKEPINIQLRGGRHQLDAAITLGPQDSGITIAAFRDEKPVLSGGRRITGWRKVDGKAGWWQANVPE